MENDEMTGSKVPIFDGKGDFQIWKRNVKDILIRDGLFKVVMDKRPTTMLDPEWEEMEYRATSTIRLGLSADIKHELLEIATTKEMWAKLEAIYASKSLTNQLCTRMELYQLKMSEGANLHDHICKFEKLVGRLKNTGDKLEEKDQALLLLARLPESYRALRQTMLLTGKSIKYDDVVDILREDELMKPKETTENAAYTVEGQFRGRRQTSPRRRQQGQYRDLSNVECFHCHEKGHMIARCPVRPQTQKINYEPQVNIVERNLGPGSDVVMAIDGGAGKED